jgi:hypothetical protein
MATPTGAAAQPRPEPTHPCVRCGRQVPLDVSLCERCNPLGLEQPATTQVHGTVFVAVALAIVGLAVIGRLVVSGVGPFSAQVRGVTAADGDRLTVTLRVQNEGTKEGTAICRLTVTARQGVGAAEVIQSPRIAAGGSREFSATVAAFGGEPVALDAACTGP